MNADGQTPIAYYRAGSTSSMGLASRSAWWRRPTAVALIIVSCLSAPAALTSAYVHRVIMNVDGYVAAVAPVAGDHAVQEAVADALAKQVNGALDAGQALPDGLPPELNAITGSLSAQLGDLTRRVTMDVVSSREFHDFWVEANRKVHPVLIRAIGSKGKVRVSVSDLVGVDLSAVTGNITGLLMDSGVSLPDVLPEELTSGEVVLLDSRPLATAGAAILALDKLYPVLPLLTAMLLLGAALVATRRSLATLYAGAGLTAAMLAVEAGLAVGRARYLGATDDAGIPRAASAAIWAAVTSSLRLWGWLVLAFGVALAVAGTLTYVAAGSSRERGHGAAERPGQAAPSYARYLYLPGEDPGAGSPDDAAGPPAAAGAGHRRPT